mgnify:CR=1 FL=1
MEFTQKTERKELMSFDGDAEDANEIIQLDESSKKESRAEDGSENNENNIAEKDIENTEITIHPTNEIVGDE